MLVFGGWCVFFAMLACVLLMLGAISAVLLDYIEISIPDKWVSWLVRGCMTLFIVCVLGGIVSMLYQEIVYNKCYTLYCKTPYK